MRRVLPLFVVVLLLGLLAGCQQQAPVAMKRRPRTYARIVSLSPSTTEIALSSLTVQGLVGRTEACNFPSYSVDKIPVLASVKPDWEKLTAAHPDFIVYDATLYSPQDVAKMEQTGATVFGFTATNLDEFRAQLFELANFLGGSARASEYVDKIQLARTSALANAIEPTRKVAVIMPGTNGQHMIAGTKSFVAEEVRASGGEPVGPDADRFVPLSPEALVSMNPAAIIVPVKDSSDQAGITSLLKDPRFVKVEAIQQRRIGAISQDVLLRMGSRIDKCIEGMARVIASGDTTK